MQNGEWIMDQYLQDKNVHKRRRAPDIVPSKFQLSHQPAYQGRRRKEGAQYLPATSLKVPLQPTPHHANLPVIEAAKPTLANDQTPYRISRPCTTHKGHKGHNAQSCISQSPNSQDPHTSIISPADERHSECLSLRHIPLNSPPCGMLLSSTQHVLIMP